MRRLAIALTAALLLLGLAVAPAAEAQPKPSITLTSAPTRIAANHSWTFGFAARHLRPKSHIELQFFGGGNWQPVSEGKPVKGTQQGRIDTQGPNELGVYVTRVAVVRFGKTVVASDAHTVYAYGTVSVAQLCRGAFRLDKFSCYSGTSDTGDGHTFHYTMDTGSRPPGDKDPLFGGPSISCRSIVLRYDADTGEINTFRLEQVGAKTVKHVSRDDHIQTARAALTGKKFSVRVNESDDGSIDFPWNGHASCYTADGRT